MIRKDSPPPFAWDSDVGHQVLVRLHAWATSVKTTEACGEGVLPSIGGGGGGGEGKPGDMPAVWHHSQDIELSLREWNAPWMRPLLRHVYVVGGFEHTFDFPQLDQFLELVYPAEMSGNFTYWERAKGRFLKDAIRAFGSFVARRRGLYDVASRRREQP